MGIKFRDSITRDVEVVSTQVKFSLCLTKHHTMNTYWRSGGIAPRIIDLCAGWK
jgi:hypothetical protein